MEIKLSRLLIGIGIFLVLCFIVAIVSSPPKTYSNGEHGFSIDPPKGWKIKENLKVDNFTSIVAFIGPVENDFSVNINIYSENSNGSDVQQYARSNKEALISIPSFNLVSEKNRTISNLESYELTYTVKLRNKDLEFKQISLIKNDESYTITFTSLKENFDKYIADFEKSVGTFKFL